MDDFPAGSILGDRFLVERTLGRGGMGVVLRARDRRLGRAVAIKVLAHALTEDAPSRERFLREARASARLNHPHVVQVFDVGETPGGEVYLVMELISGRSLRELRDDIGFSLAARVRSLTEVALALGAAHDQGIVHRDIKPDNVMVRDDGRAVVLDFGIAKRLRELPPGISQDPSTADGSLTCDGVVLGTPQYLAPEQVLGDDVDGRADQFAWGVTAYELLTGALPWRATRPVMVMAEIVERAPGAPSEVRDDLPRGFDAVILRALARDPAQRFATMTDAAEALARVDPTEVPPPPRVDAPVDDVSIAPTLQSTQPPPVPRAIAPSSINARGRWAALAALLLLLALAAWRLAA